MELAFEAQVNAQPATLWTYYSNPDLWNVWTTGLEEMSFDGEIKAGTKGRLKVKDIPMLNGVPEFTVEIISVEEEAALYNRAIADGIGSLEFSHQIVRRGKDVYLRHSVRLEKDPLSADDLAVLQSAFSYMPIAVMKIKEHVEA